MLLRPGNAGSNTVTDHKEVLAAALRQVPARFRCCPALRMPMEASLMVPM